MAETPISVTLAARNFSEYVSLVRYQGASFLLEKNGVPVARLVPAHTLAVSNTEKPATPVKDRREIHAQGPTGAQPLAELAEINEDAPASPRDLKLTMLPRLNW